MPTLLKPREQVLAIIRHEYFSCLMPYALCLIIMLYAYALCFVLGALCLLLYALCLMPCAYAYAWCCTDYGAGGEHAL